MCYFRANPFTLPNFFASTYSLPAATKLGQGNIFTSVCQEFCPQGAGEEGVCLSACWDTPPPRDQAHPPPGPGTHTPLTSHHPPRADTPPGPGTPPRTSHHHPPRDQAHPPRTRHTPPRTRHTPPRDQAPPHPRSRPPPREADCSIRSTSGRYASYWNAFLFFF